MAQTDTTQYDLDWLVSVDDHVIEPPDLWQTRLPAKYLDVGPRMVHDEQGSRWLYEDIVTPTSGLSVTRGKRKEEFSPAPVPFEEMHPSAYDPVARIADMGARRRVPPRRRPRGRRSARARARAARALPRAPRCVRRARAVERRRLVRVPGAPGVRLLHVGDHADGRPADHRDLHPSSRPRGVRPRLLRPPRRVTSGDAHPERGGFVAVPRKQLTEYGKSCVIT